MNFQDPVEGDPDALDRYDPDEPGPDELVPPFDADDDVEDRRYGE